MVLISLITLAIVATSLAFQIMTRDATNKAIRAVEARVATLESHAALAELKSRERARRTVLIGGGK